MKRSQPFNLILLGDPGAGKATQGARLRKKYGLREFDFGQWLRELKTSAARKKYSFDTTSGKGLLAPTQLAKKKFREVILETPVSQGIFFNGNPKMVGEAKIMKKTFRETGREKVLALYLSIPQREMLQRIQSRKGQSRSDDHAEHLKNRMKYYKVNIQPTVDFLKRTYHFRKIDGLGTEQEVFRRLSAAIEKFLARPEK